MLGTIPAVSRVSGKNRWLLTASLHPLASALSGGAFGAILALLGSPLHPLIGNWGLAIWLGVTFGYGLTELRVLWLPRPQRRQQVPAGWRGRFTPELVSAIYGGVLGVGVLTPIAFSSLYSLLVWVFLNGSSGYGAIVFGVYGLSRAWLPTAVALKHHEGLDQQTSLGYLHLLDSMYARYKPRLVTGCAMLFLAALSFALR